MYLSGAVGLGILVSVGVLVLVVFVVVFMRLERAPKPLEENRPPTPLGWAIPPGSAVPSGVRPATSSVAAARSDGS